MMAAPKVMPLFYYVGSQCQRQMSVVWQYVAVRQMAAEDQSDRMSSDMKVQMKQRYVIECFHSEKIVPTDICLHLLSISGDKTVDVSTARQVGGVFQQQ